MLKKTPSTPPEGGPQEQEAPASVPTTPDVEPSQPTLPELGNFDELMGDSNGMFGFSESEPAEQEKPAQPQPAKLEPPELPAQDPNDKVRYNYWQSEADKKQNEINRLQAENERLAVEHQRVLAQGQPQSVSPIQLPTLPQGTQPSTQPDTQKFPASPVRPVKPGYYNREEALSDPNSASGQYMESVEQWRNDMVEYGQLKTEYINLMQQKQFADYQAGLEAEKQSKAAEEARIQQIDGIKGTLRSKFQADDGHIEDFLKTMSNPNSISLDNLWQLYAIQQGIPIEDTQKKVRDMPAAPVAPIPPQPSQQFQQTQRAQQVPGPMGLIPGSVPGADRKVEDILMDQMKEMEEQDNPFAYQLK